VIEAKDDLGVDAAAIELRGFSDSDAKPEWKSYDEPFSEVVHFGGCSPNQSAISLTIEKALGNDVKLTSPLGNVSNSLINSIGYIRLAGAISLAFNRHDCVASVTIAQLLAGPGLEMAA
jgi:hypothetical protein